jgi:YegS/Rv2252/BmrU family lipid kinase
MKICVIFNPTARGEKARHFQAHLTALSTQCLLKPTSAPGAGRALAAEAVQQGFATIVAAGGDGTVNEVLNGIGDVPDGFQRARLAVLPLGTVNVFAKELGMPPKVQAAWNLIREGREAKIDLAEATLTTLGQPCRRYFVQMAGAGVDTRAIELVDWEQKKRLGLFAYIVAGIKAMGEAKPRIVVTDGRQELDGEQVLIGNGQFYGGRYRLFPAADWRDGLLEVSVLPRASWGRLMRGACGLFLGRLYTVGGVRHLRAETLRLSSTGSVAFQVEGENVGHLPVAIAVRPQALRVIVGKG